MQDILRGYCI